MEQCFVINGVVIARIESEENRAKGDVITDLPHIDYKVKIREIEYRDTILYVDCFKHPVGFPLTRI
jgi:hypothetical protein